MLFTHLDTVSSGVDGQFGMPVHQSPISGDRDGSAQQSRGSNPVLRRGASNRRHGVRGREVESQRRRAREGRALLYVLVRRVLAVLAIPADDAAQLQVRGLARRVGDAGVIGGARRRRQRRQQRTRRSILLVALGDGAGVVSPVERSPAGRVGGGEPVGGGVGEVLAQDDLLRSRLAGSTRPA